MEVTKQRVVDLEALVRKLKEELNRERKEKEAAIEEHNKINLEKDQVLSHSLIA